MPTAGTNSDPSWPPSPPHPKPNRDMNSPKPKKPVRLKAATRHAAAPMVADTDYDDDLEPNMKLGRAFVVVLLLHVVAVGGIFAFNSLKTTPTPGPGLAGVSQEERPVPAELRPERSIPSEKTETTSAPALLTGGSQGNPVAASASTIPQASPRVDGAIVHTLRSGETLPALARQYGVSEEALTAANQLSNTPLRVGMEIVIPPVSRTAAAPVPAEVAQFLQPPATTPATAASGVPSAGGTAGVSASGQTYTVQSGDNPYKIARDHGVSMEALLQLNGIEDPRRLQIGQVLEIPEP